MLCLGSLQQRRGNGEHWGLWGRWGRGRRRGRAGERGGVLAHGGEREGQEAGRARPGKAGRGDRGEGPWREGQPGAGGAEGHEDAGGSGGMRLPVERGGEDAAVHAGLQAGGGGRCGRRRGRVLEDVDG